MCLGVPGKVVRWLRREPPFEQAEVEFGGVRRVCHMACVPDAQEGDYVIVHAGIAISRIDAAEAARIAEELRVLGELPVPGVQEAAPGVQEATGEQP